MCVSIVRGMAVISACIGCITTASAQAGIHGRVIDAKSGIGIPNASVSLRGTPRGAMTGEDGGYRIPGLVPGRYTVTARRIGYEAASIELALVAQHDTDVTIRLVPSTSVLDKVIVTGTIIPTEVRAVPTPVTVISADQIEQQDFRRLDQAIRMFVPSALAWSTGSAAEQNSISVRGASSLTLGSPLKVYIDGIEAASGTFTMMDPSSIDRVEIIRGPQAATIYGSDAIGGVMQIFTKKGNAALDRPEVNLKVSVGDVQSAYKSGGTLRQDYSAVVSGGTPSASYTAGGSFTHTGDWLPQYYLSTPSAFAGVHIGQGKLSLDLSGRFYNTKEALTSVPFLVDAGVSSPVPPYEDVEFRQATLGARLAFDATPHWHHALSLGIDGMSFDDHNSRPRFTSPADSVMFVYVGDLRKTSMGYNTSFAIPMSASVTTTVTAGADYYVYVSNQFHTFSALNNTGSITTLPEDPTQASRDITTNTGIFAQAQVGIQNALFVTLGARKEYNDNIGTDVRAPISPRVGAAWSRQVGGAMLKIRASYGEAIRAPTSQQKDYTKNAYIEVLANPTLGPERQRGFDGGVDVAFGGRASFSMTYYDQTATDLIQSVLLDGTGLPQVSQFQNVGRVANRGIELEGGATLGIAHLTAQLARTTSRVLALGPRYGGDLRPGDQVLDIPRMTGGATLEFSPKSRTTVSLGIAYVGSRTNYDYRAMYVGAPRDALRDYWTTYPAFAKVNLGVSQTLSRSSSAFIAIENLANSNAVESSNIGALEGRTSMIGLRFHF